MNLQQRKIELERQLNEINDDIQRQSRLDNCKDLTDVLYTHPLIKDLQNDYQFEFQLNGEETPRHFTHNDFLTIKNLKNQVSYQLDVVLESVKPYQLVYDIAQMIILGQLHDEFQSQRCDISHFSRNTLRFRLKRGSSACLVKIHLTQTAPDSNEFEVVVSISSWIHEFASFTKSIMLNEVECHYDVSLDNEDEIELESKLTLPLIARPVMPDEYVNLMSTLIFEFVHHHADNVNRFLTDDVD